MNQMLRFLVIASLRLVGAHRNFGVQMSFLPTFTRILVHPIITRFRALVDNYRSNFKAKTLLGTLVVKRGEIL